MIHMKSSNPTTQILQVAAIQPQPESQVVAGVAHGLIKMRKLSTNSLPCFQTST
jgi:hypothetical protein